MRLKELRIALVCYGGVSLAVYMHGVTKELWKLARASRALNAGEAAEGPVEQAYLGLLRQIEAERDLRLRVLPDVLTGASAGGINAIFLAQAIHAGRSLEPLTRLWLEIGESVMRAGIRKLVIFNSHGGQPQIMNIVQRELRVRHGMMVVGLSWPAMGLPEGMFDANERKNGIHAGDVETSMMLHLRPDLVHMDKAQNFRTTMEEIDGRFEKLTILGGVSIGWQVQDLNPNGAAGDATKATAEKGKAVVDHVAKNFAKLLAEVADYPLELIRQR